MPGNVSKLWRYGALRLTQTLPVPHGVFSHDVTAAILVAQNNEMGAMLAYQTMQSCRNGTLFLGEHFPLFQ